MNIKDPFLFLALLMMVITTSSLQGEDRSKVKYEDMKGETLKRYGQAYDSIKMREYGVRLSLRYDEQGLLRINRFYEGIDNLHGSKVYAPVDQLLDIRIEEAPYSIHVTLEEEWNYVFIPFDMNKNYQVLTTEIIKLSPGPAQEKFNNCNPSYNRSKGTFGFKPPEEDEVTCYVVTVIGDKKLTGGGVIVPAPGVETIRNY